MFFCRDAENWVAQVPIRGRTQSGLAGDTAIVPERDLIWDAIVTASERMTKKYRADAKATGVEFRLQARSRLLWGRRRVVDGFELRWYSQGKPVSNEFVPGGLRVEFEPVRERRLFGRDWAEVQPVQGAAAAIGKKLVAWTSPGC